MRKVILAFVAGVMTVIGVDAQMPAGGDMATEGAISGKVVDMQTNQGVEYVSVGIFRMKDSTLVNGVVTNSNGDFSVSNLPYGKFYIDFKFIGYKKSRIKGVLVTPNQKRVSMGSVKLEPASTSLNEVQVTGNKAPIEYKLDKKVINVSQQLTASGGTAADVLENTPSVQTDVEGNVQLRGSSNFTVLIDGKPSVLKGSEALQQIPASTIQSIEIITNPSAKYDPDGSAGIINVVLKKEKMSGVTGLANVSAATGDKYNGDVLLNFKTPKFSYTLGGEYNDTYFKMNGIARTARYSSGDTLFQNTAMNGKFYRSRKAVKAGIEYAINDNNTLALSGRYSIRNGYRDMNVDANEFTSPVATNTFYKRNNHSGSDHSSYNLNLDYLLKLNDKGQQLAATLYYSDGPEKETTDYTQHYTDSQWAVIDSIDPVFQRAIQDNRETEYRGKLDYTLPIGEKGKLEAGYQGRWEGVNGDYRFLNFTNNQWVENTLRYNKLEYIDHIEGAYATFSNSASIFDYQLGLRSELTDRHINQKVTGEKYPLTRVDFFPTLHLSKQLPLNIQLMASYSRRINRPNDFNLDPYPMYMDERTYRQGNPSLKPEFTDSYELNAQKRIGEAFISVDGFFRRTNDLISQVTNVRADKVSIMTFTNMNHDQSTGAEFMLNIPVNQMLTLNASSSAYHYQLFGSLQDTTLVSKSSNTWNSRINATFRFSWGMQLQANFFYNAATVTAQGKRDAMYFSSIGIRQDVLKKRMSITLQARDWLGNMRFAFNSKGANFTSYNLMKREAPVITLSVSYKINNFKQNKRSGDDSGSSGGTNESDFNGGM